MTTQQNGASEPRDPTMRYFGRLIKQTENAGFIAWRTIVDDDGVPFRVEDERDPFVPHHPGFVFEEGSWVSFRLEFQEELGLRIRQNYRAVEPKRAIFSDVLTRMMQAAKDILGQGALEGTTDDRQETLQSIARQLATKGESFLHAARTYARLLEWDTRCEMFLDIFASSNCPEDLEEAKRILQTLHNDQRREIGLLSLVHETPANVYAHLWMMIYKITSCRDHLDRARARLEECDKEYDTLPLRYFLLNSWLSIFLETHKTRDLEKALEIARDLMRYVDDKYTVERADSLLWYARIETATEGADQTASREIVELMRPEIERLTSDQRPRLLALCDAIEQVPHAPPAGSAPI